MPPTEAEVRAIVQRVLVRLMDAPAGPEAGAQRAVGRAGAGSDAAAVPPGARTLVTEAAVRALNPGATWRVPADALVTPLAREVARERGITLLEDAATVPAQALGRSRVSAAQRVAIGADHGGYALKEALKPHLQSLGYEVVDCGTHSTDPVDYPDVAYAVARLVAEGGCANGIVIDGAGIGSCMAANKVPGVRAAMCYDHATAVNSREHNHANVLTLGAGLIGVNLAKQIVQTWLATPFGGERHARRVEKIAAIERRYIGTRP
ncbi:MAG: ribose 5-phosphate isomerase B [Anaerolineae bacterium]